MVPRVRTWPFLLISLGQSPRLKGERKIRPFVWPDNVLLILPWETIQCVRQCVRVGVCVGSIPPF